MKSEALHILENTIMHRALGLALSGRRNNDPNPDRFLPMLRLHAFADIHCLRDILEQVSEACQTHLDMLRPGWLGLCTWHAYGPQAYEDPTNFRNSRLTRDTYL